ncbi:GNAT family N-acetyltransferase [Formosa sp. A9]|uniref:GNAT family N-acetyltransferase n=1 Tax=Formosa sp. A9 TaxID=3442641 RepID=UPI003EC0EA9E
MELVIKQIINENDFKDYIKAVDSFNIVNPFYKNLGANLNDLLGDQLHYFILKSEHNTILILMPFLLRKINSDITQDTYFDITSPYGYSGPLFNQNLTKEQLVKFWSLVDDWYRDNNVVSEFIRFSLNDNHNYYSGTLVPTLTNVKGRIMPHTDLWNNFKQKVRNNYRKSISYNLKIQVLRHNITKENVQLFHNIYTQTMTRINASKEYFFSFNYFNNIVELNQGNCLIVFIYKEHIAISTELILISGDTLFSYLGGTLSDYFNTRPNDFLKIEVMKWARDNNINCYVLGGGREDNDSLYQYKKSFFPNDQDVVYYTGRKIINATVYKKLTQELQNQVDAPDNQSNYFPSYRPQYTKVKTK